MMLGKLRALGRVFVRTRYQGLPDIVRLLIKRPAIMAAVGTYETALLVTGKMDERLKCLAVLKASSLVGCPF